MSKIFHVLKEVLEDPNLTYLDKAVFTSLITFNGKNKIFPSLSEICKRITCNSKNNVSVSIKKLRECNYIEVSRRFQKSNIYIIKDVNTDMKIKKKLTKKPETPEMRYKKSILYSVIFIYTKIQNRSTESSDFAYINRLLKLKSKDDLSYSVKCLMLCYILKTHSDKTDHNAFKGILYNSYRDLSYTDFKNKLDVGIYTGSIISNEYETFN